MKDFVPQDEEFASDKMFIDTINAAKRSFIQVVNEADKTKFNKAEIDMIQELTQIIEKSKGLNFGKEYDALFRKITQFNKKQKTGNRTSSFKTKVTIPNLLRKLKY